MNKFLTSIILVFGLWIASPALAQEKISNYQVDIQMQTDSSLQVIEQINYDFGSAQKHGILRQIPINYQGENKNFSLNINIINVLDQQGQAYQYTTDQTGDYLVVKIGDAKRYVSGQQTYIINYTVQGSVLFFDNYDEFYWNVIGSDWQIPVVQASVNLFLPAPATTSQSTIKCWSGVYGGKSDCQVLSSNTSGDQFNVITAQHSQLQPKQAFTILVQVPKGIFDEIAASNLLKTQTNLSKQKLFGSPWLLIWPILVLLLMYYWWYHQGRDPKGRGNIIVEYDVPNDLRPAEVGAIVYENFANKFLTAEIIYLATHGYLRITRQPKTGVFGKEDYILTKLKTADNSLKKYEQDLLKFLFNEPASQEQIKLSELKDTFYIHIELWKKELWTLLKTEKYYAHTGQTEKVLLLVLGLVFIGLAIPLFAVFGLWGILAMVLSGGIVIIFSRLMPQKTSSGVLIKEYLLGLKEYLEVAEKDRLKFHNAPDKDPKVFEKLLPYAIVFGVEDQWADKFKDIYQTPPSWYSDPSLNNFNAALFVGSLHSFSSLSIRNLTPPTHSSTGAGGFGGGGGFSGGGFGGGGGGSW